ncbi:hypothetical protein I553_6014 [Mycobacterium xenopi 4042]|uniref:Uncharacterized protein n=1 Tax=Mycobacterium xenopi 4042 TaxID=1299334 RepID=X8BE67_MYCXE|nr:hypothetical protein I553_6014 [Mycobacterium xenopi 4042]
MLPCVDRRSPAITTPPGYFRATIVVPWRSWLPAARQTRRHRGAHRQQLRRLPTQEVGKRGQIYGTRWDSGKC